MAKPITPKEAGSAKAAAKVFPDAVFDAFNELITKAFDGREARITFPVAAKAIAEKMGVAVEEVWKNSWWLDVEQVYRSAGWEVKTDSPGYCESYTGFYVFRKRTRGQDS